MTKKKIKKQKILRHKINNDNNKVIAPYYDEITVCGRGVCFVCCLPIYETDKIIKIGRHPRNGKILERHSDCCIGSDEWRTKFGDSVLSKHKKFRDRGKQWMDDQKED